MAGLGLLLPLLSESPATVATDPTAPAPTELQPAPTQEAPRAMNPEDLDRHIRTSRPFRTPVPLTLTVGPDTGMLRGTDDKVIQAAIDYLDRMGGGVVLLAPGTYTLGNAIHLRPKITLRGSGAGTLLTRGPSVTTPVIRDSDWYEYAVRVKDPSGFLPGNGIHLSTMDDQKIPKYLFATITAVQDDVIFFDRRTEFNFWLSGEAKASTLFSLLSGRNVDDVRIEDLVLDGNREHVANVNDNFGASVFMQYCNRWEFRNVVSRNYNGDGFSFQVCDDIRFENCQAIGNADLGFHPGSGSQRPSFRNCIATGNSQGLFFCWGVSDGIAENCRLADNLRYGISIGHRDTDNLIRNCLIENNREVGVLFRKERWEFDSGDRNRVENCVIRDNGIGVDIRWVTKDVTIRDCRFENSSGKQSTAIRIEPDVQRVNLESNTFSDTTTEVDDLRTGSAPAK
jgi:hypothetical protein